MVPGYGEELEMGFNATSQCNCKPNPHKYNGKLATGHNRAHWCGPLHFAQYNANGPQLICTHFVEKEFCWKGKCYVGTLRKSSGFFLSWAQSSSNAIQRCPCLRQWHMAMPPRPITSYQVLAFFCTFVFYFISYLLLTIYYLSYSLQTGTHDRAPTTQNSLSSTLQKFWAFMFHYICCRQWLMGACQQAP